MPSWLEDSVVSRLPPGDTIYNIQLGAGHIQSTASAYFHHLHSAGWQLSSREGCRPSDVFRMSAMVLHSEPASFHHLHSAGWQPSSREGCLPSDVFRMSFIVLHSEPASFLLAR